MREAEFTAKLLKALRAHPALRGGEVWKINDRTSAGRPDVQIILDGMTTYFELKVHPYKLTKLQEYYLKRIKRAYAVNAHRNFFCIVSLYDYGYSALDLTFDECVQEIVELCKAEFQIASREQRESLRSSA